MKTIVLIDSHAIIHRAYHALPPLTMKGGEPVGAVYGFASILLRILKELKPDYIAAAFDMPGKTFRHEQYEAYKAHRPPAPDDLKSQFAKVHDLVDAFGIASFQKEGYEADDVIGTLADKIGRKKDCEVIIVTGDSDMLQLVRPRVKVYTMKKGVNDITVYDEAGVRERYGLGPVQLIDFKGLKGDASDNIKGVKGIGEKTAGDLLRKFGSIENMYAQLEKGVGDISNAVAEKLYQGKEDALFSRELVRIATNVPLGVRIEDMVWRDGLQSGAIIAMLEKFGFSSLIKRFLGNGNREKNDDSSAKKPPTKESNQLSLLSSVGGIESDAIAHYATAMFQKFCKKHQEQTLIGLLKIGERLCVIDKEYSPFLLDKNVYREKRAKDFFSHHQFVAHDAKEIIKFLHERNIELGEISFDTILAAYLADSSQKDFSWSAVASREFGRPMRADAADDLKHFFELVALMEKKLRAIGAEKVFYPIELPLTRTVARMEEMGILLDGDFLRVMSAELEKKLRALTQEIYQLAGEEFNINSSQQLSHILFNVLELQTRGLKKTEKGGVISTRESELEKLRDAHPMVRAVLDYRQCAKLKSTYVDALPLLVDPRDGRVHTTFHQMGATTGRMSSANPNLQNIPILSEYGRTIRKAFIAQKGFVLVSCDYSQIELRVAAHLAHDEKMIAAFLNGADIHALTASEVYHVPLGEVTPELRRAAKTLNFGVLYGMGANAFAESTSMSREDAGRFITEYFRDFSGVHQFIEKTKEFAREHGYVETLFGRRRYILEIVSQNFRLRREAERMAVNHPIQGTATGDIIKLAMVKIGGWISEEKCEKDVRLLLQVHDELVFEVREKSVMDMVPKVKRIMENVVKLTVPLVVDVKVGYNWGEQKIM